MAIAAILILSCGEKQPARIEHAIPEIPELYDCTPTAEIAESIAKSGECQSLETVSHLLRALDLQFTQDRLEAVDAAEALNDPCATEVLFRALGNRDQEVRVHAMVALGRPDGDLRAYELLCNILKNDKDGGIRLLAMHALCDLAGKHALGVFSAGVKDENFKVREESCRFIGYLGMPQSLDPLLMCRKDSHADVRYAAADAFAWLGEADLVIESLKDQDRRVRALAVEKVGMMQIPDTEDMLIEATHDSAHNVRYNAFWSLGRIHTPKALDALIEVLKEGKPENRHDASGPLRFFHYSWAVDPLLDVLASGEAEPWAVVDALEGTVDSTSLDKVIPLLKHPDAEVRQAACRLLGSIGDQRAVPMLVGALNDTVWDVKEFAADALGMIKDKKAVKPLIAKLKDPDFEPLFAISALGEIGDPKAVKHIMKFLDDSYVDCVAITAGALGKLGDNKAVKPLLALITSDSKEYMTKYDEHEYFLGDVATALGALGNQSVVKPLKVLITKYLNTQVDSFNYPNSDEYQFLIVRTDAVIQVLGEIGGPEAEEALMEVAANDANHYFTSDAYEALGKLKATVARDLLIEGLQSEREKDRIAAAVALAAIGEKNAAALLIDALGESLSDCPLCPIDYYASILDFILETSIVDDLAVILSKDASWKKRRLAALLLGNIGAERSIQPLMEALEDEHWLVRNAALKSLEDMTDVNLGLKKERWEKWLKTKQKHAGSP